MKKTIACYTLSTVSGELIVPSDARPVDFRFERSGLGFKLYLEQSAEAMPSRTLMKVFVVESDVEFDSEFWEHCLSAENSSGRVLHLLTEKKHRFGKTLDTENRSNTYVATQ